MFIKIKSKLTGEKYFCYLSQLENLTITFFKDKKLETLVLLNNFL